MGMDKATAILEAMCKDQGIEISPTVEEAEGSASSLPMQDGSTIGDVDSYDT